MTARKKLGKLIKEKRLSRRITLRDFCKLNDIDAIYASAVERGEDVILKHNEMFNKIIDALFVAKELNEIIELMRIIDDGDNHLGDEVWNL